MGYSEICERAPGVKILVIGDIMLDHYIHGRVERISPEAPVPVLVEGHHQYALGGAANVALNASSLGAQVTLIGSLGEDEESEIVKKVATERSIELRTCKSTRTETKMRLMAEGQQLLRVDRECGGRVENCPELVGEYNAVIVSDYNKGFLECETIEKILNTNVPVIVDTKPSKIDLYRGVDLITPNLSEALRYVQSKSSPAERPQEVCEQTFELSGIPTLLTAGSGGIFFNTTAAFGWVSPYKVEKRDPTGAGDVVTSTMGVCLGAGMEFMQAVNLANRAAALSVSHLGTYAVGLDELRESIERDPLPTPIGF